MQPSGAALGRLALVCALSGGLLLPAPAPAAADVRVQVVGGATAPDGAWPYQVSLNLTARHDGGDDLLGHFCGGTVIAPRWVLTAAHCVLDRGYRDYEVVTGRTRLSGAGGVTHEVEQAWVLQDYLDGNRAGPDIALVRLTAPATVPPAPLPDPRDPVAQPPQASNGLDNLVVTVGWGSVDAAGSVYPDNLKQATTTLWSGDDCLALGAVGRELGDAGIDASRQLCAGGQVGVGSCFGDSGGPLMRRDGDGTWQQIGVASGVFACAGPLPGIYTSTAAHKGFVDTVLARYGEGSPFGVSLAPPALRTTRCHDAIPAAELSDVPADSVHRPAIDCLVFYGIATGTAPGLYLPSAAVTRAQVAAFLVRTIAALGGPLPSGADPGFTDIARSPHADSIALLAAAGITAGTSASTYSPQQPVTRAQTASLLVRTYEYLMGGPVPAAADAFDDDDGSPHEPNINKARALGIAGGTDPRTFAPHLDVRRDQMATFVSNLLQALAEAGYDPAG